MSAQYIRDRNKRTWRVYAYRGGPLIMKVDSPRKPKLTADALRKQADALAALEPKPDEERTRAMIRAWQKSPEWQALEPGTRKTWQPHLDRIEAKWGDAPKGVWNDARMKAKVVDWRDERRDKPRTADIGVTVLQALLKWAILRGQGVTVNVAADIPQLYKGGNRQDIIWTEADLEAFTLEALKANRPQLIDCLDLARFTGFRLSDLATLTFAHIGEMAITKVALKKSKGRRRRATIPMTPALERFLAEARTRDRAPGVETVLVNAAGRSWTPGGLGGQFGRITNAAGIVHVDEDTGRKRKKHLHDVRGTFCTMLLTEWELTDEQAAQIMAWSSNRVSEIRRVYVDDARVVVAIAERIAAKRIAKQ